MTLAKWNFVSAILLVIALVLEEVKSECLFPNTSMISPTACSRNDSRSLMPRMLACLSYLAEDDTAPNAKCCAGVRNVSAVSPPCLCKHVFYPGSMVNHTRGKLMPVLCNVTFDLCRVCSAFLVDRVWEPHHSWANSEREKISSYKKKVVGLAVVLGLAVACVMVGIALLIRKKLKHRKTLPPAAVNSHFNSTKPGSDY